MQRIYSSTPLKVIGNIPIFIEYDSYVENYEKISLDHIKSLEKNGTNPFMQQSQILESNDALRQMIKRHVDVGSVLLDAGIGYGELFQGLPEYIQFGVDVSLPYLRIAKNNGIEVCMAKLEKLPYCDDSFDAIISSDVLEHVLRIDKAVSELIRVLKPGGMLIVRVPFDESLDEYINNPKYTYSHIRSFNLNSLRLLFESCFGLKFIEYKYTGYDFLINTQIKFQPPSINSEFRNVIDSLLNKPTIFNNTEFFKSSPLRKKLRTLKKLCLVSLEEIESTLISIRDLYPETYKLLSPCLIKPLEIISVFTKPKNDT